MKLDADPFGSDAIVAPVSEKSKTDLVPPNRETAGEPKPGKPETADKTDAEPFGPDAVAAPVSEKSKTDLVPPSRETASEPRPGKPETADKTDADPFGPPLEVAPPNEKSTTDAKPDLSIPIGPETPGKPEKPGPDTSPSATPDLKPDTPVIGPPPTSPVKPDVTPESTPPVKPDLAPESTPPVKPAAGVGPLQAPSFPAADLDASLKAVSGAAAVDAKSYADWCKLAEVVTYVKDGRRFAEAGPADPDREGCFQPAGRVGDRRRRRRSSSTTRRPRAASFWRARSREWPPRTASAARPFAWRAWRNP